MSVKCQDEKLELPNAWIRADFPSFRPLKMYANVRLNKSDNDKCNMKIIKWDNKCDKTYYVIYVRDNLLRRYARIALKQLTNIRGDLLNVVVVPRQRPLVPGCVGHCGLSVAKILSTEAR